MPRLRGQPNRAFIAAKEAALRLAQQKLNQSCFAARMVALGVAGANERVEPKSKSVNFYRHFLQWQVELTALLADAYRVLFKLALAHSAALKIEPEGWTRSELQPLINAALEAIDDWCIVACDEFPTAMSEFVSANSWRAPAWLFQVSAVYRGIGKMKKAHMPPSDSDEKLSAAHTRLLLTGAHRVFLRDLRVAAEFARDQELVAAGSVAPSASHVEQRKRINRKGREGREKLHNLIRTLLTKDPSLEGLEFCRELDRHHAKPLHDWIKRGEWRTGLTFAEAWANSGWKKKIRRVRQEAMKRR